jgi:putative membrane protein
MQKQQENSAEPRWLKGKINSKDLQKISATIDRVETRTSAEIVPMIVERSSTLGHSQLLVFLFLSLIGLAVTPRVLLFDTLGLVGAWIISYLLLLIPKVQRLVIGRNELAHQVDLRAHLEFYSSNIKATHQHTGILIFVSLFEQRALVLADEAIAKKLPDSTWNNLINELLIELKAGRVVEGFIAAIEQCGALVEKDFPATSESLSHELSNQLIIKP